LTELHEERSWLPVVLATSDLAEHIKDGHADFLLEIQRTIAEDHLFDMSDAQVVASGNLYWERFKAEEKAEEERKLAEDKQRSIFRIRLLIAVSSGLALIAPMLIMTLHQSKLTSLLTTSVFVVAVAVVLAWVMDDAENKDIVAATAAYAAVLVVFVGTGSGSTS